MGWFVAGIFLSFKRFQSMIIDWSWMRMLLFFLWLCFPLLLDVWFEMQYAASINHVIRVITGTMAGVSAFIFLIYVLHRIFNLFNQFKKEKS